MDEEERKGQAYWPDIKKINKGEDDRYAGIEKYKKFDSFKFFWKHSKRKIKVKIKQKIPEHSFFSIGN